MCRVRGSGDYLRGSSFLFIKIAVSEANPVTVVALSHIFGLLDMAPLTRVMGQRFPRDRFTYLCYPFIAVFNGILPFVLTSWGEMRIDSAMASILNGTVPLFTIIIAHFWLTDEKITNSKMLGLVVGLIEVVYWLAAKQATCRFEVRCFRRWRCFRQPSAARSR